MMSRVDQNRRALVVLAAAALLSVACTYVFLVRPFGLLPLAEQPLLDLFRLSKVDSFARQRLVAGYVSLGALYWVGWRASRQVTGRAAWGIVLAAALASSALLLFVYPFGAADIFDNIMHGRILGVYGANPFRDVIKQFGQDPLSQYAAWRAAPAAYGPAWELAAGAVAWVAQQAAQGVRFSLGVPDSETLRLAVVTNVLAFKLLGVTSLVASCGLVAVVLRRLAPERALAGVLLLAWNPVVLVETVGHGHNDLAMMVWVLAAAWAVARQRHTLAILFLVAGGLVKYIPLLMVPTAALIAFRSLPTVRARRRYAIVTSLAMAGLVAAAYAPFWVGPETLSIERRQDLLTASLPAAFWAILQEPWGAEAAGVRISLAAAGLTAGFALWQAMRASRDTSWLGFPRAAFSIVVFYLLVTCLWLQNWYAVWPLALAALLPAGFEVRLAMVFGFASLAKPLIFEPLWLWQRPLPAKPWRELRLGPAILAIPWLYVLVTWARASLSHPTSPTRTPASHTQRSTLDT